MKRLFAWHRSAERAIIRNICLKNIRLMGGEFSPSSVIRNDSVSTIEGIKVDGYYVRGKRMHCSP